MNKYTSLEDLYRSVEFDNFRADLLGNDLFISDPERADRISKAAEDGADGSYHAEIIQDWRDFLSTLSIIDPDFSPDGDITEEVHDSIVAEIDACEAWHEKNGSLWQEVG
jgi:hypothetical protein